MVNSVDLKMISILHNITLKMERLLYGVAFERNTLPRFHLPSLHTIGMLLSAILPTNCTLCSSFVCHLLTKRATIQILQLAYDTLHGNYTVAPDLWFII